MLRQQWPPAKRLVATVAGGILTIYGARKKSVLGAALSSVGMGLLGRGVSNKEIKDLIAGRNGVERNGS